MSEWSCRSQWQYLNFIEPAFMPKIPPCAPNPVALPRKLRLLRQGLNHRGNLVASPSQSRQPLPNAHQDAGKHLTAIATHATGKEECESSSKYKNLQLESTHSVISIFVIMPLCLPQASLPLCRRCQSYIRALPVDPASHLQTSS